MRKTPEEIELPLRITMIHPPAGFHVCLQRGKADLFGVVISAGKDVSWDFSVRAKDVGDNAPPRFLGPFAQGPASERFVYVCSGTLAGQTGTSCTRRAKIPLSSIDWKLIRKAVKLSGAKLEARFQGTAKDGYPSCATCPLEGGGWKLIR